jgi:hypothetical protein
MSNARNTSGIRGLSLSTPHSALITGFYFRMTFSEAVSASM